MSKSGDSSDKKKTDTKTTPATTTPTPSVPAQTFQPMMPGFQNALAEQLAAGFGGAPADFATMLAGLYQPMMLGKAGGGSGSGASGTGSSTGASVKLLNGETMDIKDYYDAKRGR